MSVRWLPLVLGAVLVAPCPATLRAQHVLPVIPVEVAEIQPVALLEAESPFIEIDPRVEGFVFREPSPHSGLPVFHSLPIKEAPGGHQQASMEEFVYPSLVDNPSAGSSLSRTLHGWWEDGCGLALEAGHTIVMDFKHNYTGRNLAGLGLALVIAAPLANTQADQNFRDWYQKRARSATSDRWAQIGNKLGEHWVTVPAYLGAMALGKLTENTWAGSTLEDWGWRSTRAMICGFPSVVTLQVVLGAGRPEEGTHRWQPFKDSNAVAGHGFVGAVPFLTAAAMTESRPLKALFVVGSFWTCASRINTDAHYLSQAVLGWSIAFLAVDAVNQTNLEKRRWQIVPVEVERGTGIGVLVNY